MKALPSVRLVFDRKHHATDYRSTLKEARTGLVQLELHYAGSRRWFGTGVKVYKGQWSDHLHVINHPSSPELNTILTDVVVKANALIAEMVRAGSFSVELFSSRLQPKSASNEPRTLFSAVEDMCNECAISKSKSTHSQYRALLTHLVRYSKMRYISDIDNISLLEFDKWLRHTVKLKSQTIFNYHAKLKCVLNREVALKNIPSNPYGSCRISRPRPNDITFLTDDEIDKVKAFSTCSRIDRLAVDLWLFQMYTGLSFADARNLELMRDFELIDGRYILRSKRKKTGVKYVLALVDPAVKLIIEHGGSFKGSTRQYIYHRLDKIGQSVIGRPLHTHDARRTFAVKALHNGVSIEIVSKMLGHTNITQTQRYAKVLEDDVRSEYERLNDIFTGISCGAPRIVKPK